MTGKYKTGLTLLLILLIFVPSVCTASAESSANSDDNMTQITKNVYVYGYPLVLVDITRGQMTATSRPDMTKAPVNQFLRAMKTPTALFTGIVSPNVDTLYSNTFIDLSGEPIVLSVPDTNGRYYLMPLIDSWSNVFASPGKRTTGTEAGNFLISGPGWQGIVPNGMTEIKAPTNAVWLLGRTLVNSTDPDDMAAVRTIQEDYMLTPLSAWGTNYTPPVGVFVDPLVDKITPPVDQVANMTPEQFYSRLNRLLKENPPPETDSSMVQEMAELGIGSDMSFEWNSTDPKIRNALTQGAAAGLAEIVRTAKASSLLPQQTTGTL